MNPILILTIFLLYSILLFTIAYFTSRKATNETYFTGNRKSPWYVVAYGMIGASLSGVTFISIPGEVTNSHFTYMMIVFGYLVGYSIIAEVLLPMYYKLNLTSIYTYLEQRFGMVTYKTGSIFFIISRSIGSSFRVYLVVNVLQVFVFDAWNVPFSVTASLFILLILLYTFKGGIKTIVWTDTLQTTFMLLAVGFSIYILKSEIGVSFTQLFHKINDLQLSKIIETNFNSSRFFVKQFLSGAFIAVVMTGLDQDMMQKNLSCKSLKDAKKNMYLMSWLLVPVNALFLLLGAMLFVYAAQFGIEIPARTDDFFPLIALKYSTPIVGIMFLIGLIAAAYSSADGSLAALTTAFCVDIIGINRNKKLNEIRKIKVRKLVHLSFAVFLLFLVVFFRAINDDSVINKLFIIAGYTYGPLLGLYAFGLFTKLSVYDTFVPFITILSPTLCYIININSVSWFNGYKFGFELLIINGIITFLGLYLNALIKKI